MNRSIKPVQHQEQSLMLMSHRLKSLNKWKTNTSVAAQLICAMSASALQNTFSELKNLKLAKAKSSSLVRKLNRLLSLVFLQKKSLALFLVKVQPLLTQSSLQRHVLFLQSLALAMQSKKWLTAIQLSLTVIPVIFSFVQLMKNVQAMTLKSRSRKN